MDSEGGQIRNKRKDLSHFYGMTENGQQTNVSFNFNSKDFSADGYLQNCIKEKNFKQLLEEESTLVNDIQRLDSECQTLVYDHYDKFIAATDIVRQMKEGSSEMSEQIGKLQENMAKITESSKSITSDLQLRRDNLSHYLCIHSTLKKLQFLFLLPAKINECIKEQKYAEGVRCYQETVEVLQKYSHLPSFTSTNADCQEALEKLKASLKQQLLVNEGSTQQLAQYVDLLLQLREPADDLCVNFLSQARLKLEKDLNKLTTYAQCYHSDKEEDNLDILQFIDVCHDTFLANLWLVISSYKEMFIRASGKLSSANASEKLCSFVCLLVEEYVAVVNVRVAREEEVDHINFPTMATALDKFHRRLHAISQLLPGVDFSKLSLNTTLEVAKHSCDSSFRNICDSFGSSVADVRHSLALPKTITQDRSIATELNELLTKLVATTASNIKEAVEIVLGFSQPKYTFAMDADFRSMFCRQFVREGLVVRFFHFIAEELDSYCHKKNKDPSLLLLLSRMCLDLHTSSVHYLLNHCDELLQIEDKSGLTSLQALTSEMMVTGQNLLNRYVTTQGSSVSQLLRRSVELKDWLGCSEPRSVRKVMRTVKEEIALMDVQVGALFEEGTRKDRSSDSSRRTMHSTFSTSRHGQGKTWTGYSSNLDDSLVANLTKLWSEKIEIFAPVEFTKTSILTGIVKISLKTLLESVRLKTLSRFGFQQIQIDVHYLKTYLWPYVADERILYVLLDEILMSASLRCTSPDIMDSKVVEFICEQI